jgi:NADPH:quinone reductase-like Zn-dependent oxidoreductase
MSATQMRAIEIRKHGGPEVLAVREAADPTPGPGEIRVRVAATGLNFADVMARMGLYPDAPKPPCVVGYEASGTVDALGAGVTTFAPGDRVVALTRFGGQADVVCVPAAQLRKIPASMTFEQAAAIPVNYLTAFHMLHRVANARPGMKVLVHMAAGGVGQAAIQLLKRVPDVTIIGTASASKHDVIRGWGVTHAIDYRTTDYAVEVRKITENKGVDIVLDALGGDDWKKGYDLLAPAGHLVAFGFANMRGGNTRNLFRVVSQFFDVPKFSPLDLMDKNRAVSGVNVGHLWSEIAMLGAELDELLVMFEKGEIAPHIDSTHPFSKAAEAHARLEERKNVGKVLLIPG